MEMKGLYEVTEGGFWVICCVGVACRGNGGGKTGGGCYGGGPCRPITPPALRIERGVSKFWRGHFTLITIRMLTLTLTPVVDERGVQDSGEHNINISHSNSKGK